jgi:xanthine dehydrogenase YagS FAD-binding subunit
VKPFTYAAAADLSAAAQEQQRSNSALIAGGTCLVDLMKLYVMQPDHLVDIRKGVSSEISDRGSSIYIGAGATNATVAHHPLIISQLPVLSKALLSGASPQLRNAATVGGNIMQRTRCPYFRDTVLPCNKRQPQSGCSAIDGLNRGHAILGTSDSCIATHPSDMCVAMAMLDASIHLADGSSSRQVPFLQFHVEPGDHPDIETILKPGEVISAVEIGKAPLHCTSHYLKIRERASFTFALVSAAVALQVSSGIIKGAKLALGGVATKPWRATAAEQSLVGQSATSSSYLHAAEIALQGAKPRKYNKFKVELAKRTIVRAYEELQDAIG